MDQKEYIERGALIKKIIESRDNNPYSDPNIELHHHVEHNKFIAMAAHQPAEDVVEVVRCKVCKHFKRNCGMASVSPNGYCFNLQETMNAEDFCSYGERRNEK